MGLTDKSLLHAQGVQCKVDPTVLFQVADHYSRRDEGQDFVVGTLLGTEDAAAGVVLVCSCFQVPHTSVDGQIALNSEFYTTMLELQQRVESKHKVVGWYSTGEAISDATILFHEFFEQQGTERPVHLLLDLGLGTQTRMRSKAFVSDDVTLGDARVATLFREVPLQVVCGVCPTPPHTLAPCPRARDSRWRPCYHVRRRRRRHRRDRWQGVQRPVVRSPGPARPPACHPPPTHTHTGGARRRLRTVPTHSLHARTNRPRHLLPRPPTPPTSTRTAHPRRSQTSLTGSASKRCSS